MFSERSGENSLYPLIQREFPVRKGGGESLLRNFLGVRFEYETKTTSTYSVQNTISRSICNKVQTKNLGKGCMPVVGIKISRNSKIQTGFGICRDRNG